jgi:hypothetical protein
MADEQPKEKHEAQPVATPATIVPPAAVEVPDPDEDDLDDLDGKNGACFRNYSSS